MNIINIINLIVFPIIIIAIIAFVIWYRYVKKWVFAKILDVYSENVYEIIATKRINPKEIEFNFSNFKYMLNLEKSILDKRKRPNVYYIKNNPNPVSFYKVKSNIDAQFLKSVVESDIWSQILGKRMDEILLYLLIVLVVAVLGFLILMYYNDSKIIKLLMESIKTTTDSGVIIK